MCFEVGKVIPEGGGAGELDMFKRQTQAMSLLTERRWLYQVSSPGRCAGSSLSIL